MNLKAAQEAKIREEEIRPDDLFTEFMRLSVEDAENFFGANDLVEIDCPGCGADAPGPDSFVKHTFHYAHCTGCGSLYASPRPTKSRLLDYYAHSNSQKFWADTILPRTDASRKASILLPAINRVEAILEEHKIQHKSILDVGAANGAFLQEWKSRRPEIKIRGIEPGNLAASNCRKTGAQVFEGFVEDQDIRDKARGDLVTCFEVLEHVQDPQNFANAIYDVTEQGGCAILSCLGADGFDIQVLWEKSRSITPPYHLNFLSEIGLRALFEKAGFTSVTIISPGRMDVEIVTRSISRGLSPQLSRFEQLLLKKGDDVLARFQEFLAQNRLSSHIWIIARK